MKTLNEIYSEHCDPNPAGGHGDKGTAHSYIDSYEKLLTPYRDKSINLLEIGIAYGESLEMWYKFFHNGKIHGADIHDIEIFSDKFKPGGYKNDERFKIWIEDATQYPFLDTIKDISFDIVVDDGSHRVTDQIQTFNMFKKSHKINKGGIYIIEDVNGIDNHKNSFEELHENCEIIDLRKVKGRHDDVLVIYKF
jgi:hypothetical protein